MINIELRVSFTAYRLSPYRCAYTYAPLLFPIASIGNVNIFPEMLVKRQIKLNCITITARINYADTGT